MTRPDPEIMAETGPGLPDDAVAEGQLPPGELGAGAETAAQALRKRGWVGGGAPEERPAPPSAEGPADQGRGA